MHSLSSLRNKENTYEKLDVKSDLSDLKNSLENTNFDDKRMISVVNQMSSKKLKAHISPHIKNMTMVDKLFNNLPRIKDWTSLISQKSLFWRVTIESKFNESPQEDKEKSVGAAHGLMQLTPWPYKEIYATLFDDKSERSVYSWESFKGDKWRVKRSPYDQVVKVIGQQLLWLEGEQCSREDVWLAFKTKFARWKEKINPLYMNPYNNALIAMCYDRILELKYSKKIEKKADFKKEMWLITAHKSSYKRFVMKDLAVRFLWVKKDEVWENREKYYTEFWIGAESKLTKIIEDICTPWSMRRREFRLNRQYNWDATQSGKWVYRNVYAISSMFIGETQFTNLKR